MTGTRGAVPSAARYWVTDTDGRVRCEVCPRECRLREGQRGFCYVRMREGDALVLDTYGRSSGFCLDPIEKKPLAHFLPGTSVLSFGTAGCNLGCRYCQNFDISTARAQDALADEATPEQIAEAAAALGARSVAFTYNDPVIFTEYAIDVAAACRARGVASVAVTAGYVQGEARRDLFGAVDAANVDLKGFTEDFYRKITGGRLGTVLETLTHIAHETSVWLEVTTLVIPGYNDDDAQLAALTGWIARELSPDVPLHLSAFHPDHRMRDVPRTPLATLRRARQIAVDAGLRYVYLGNVIDPEAEATSCAHCGALLIGRDRYRITAFRLRDGSCPSCGAAVPGVFERRAGDFGNRRLPVRLA